MSVAVASPHEQLDSLVVDAIHADNLAERIVALRVAADGRAQTVAESTKVFPDRFLGDDTVEGLVVEQLNLTIDHARATLGPLDGLDLVCQDFLIQLLQVLEKHRWMFEAQIEAG